MLSPSIITKSNGNSCRTAFIRFATSYCGTSPVPMSPIAANLTEPVFSGNLNSSARTQKTIKLTIEKIRIRRLRMSSTALYGFGKDSGNSVNDQACFDVQKDQVAAHNPVRHLIGQFRKLQQ